MIPRMWRGLALVSDRVTAWAETVVDSLPVVARYFPPLRRSEICLGETADEIWSLVEGMGFVTPEERRR